MRRICNTAAPGLPLAAPEPLESLSLPISDRAWDVRDAGGGLPDIASPAPAELGTVARFSTACQATHLLGHVLKHRDARKTADSDEIFRLKDAFQIHATLMALDERVLAGPEGSASAEDGNFEAIAILCSARFILYNIYGCRDPDVRSSQAQLELEFALRRAAIDGIVALTSDRVPRIAQHILTRTSLGAGARGRGLSPTLCHSLYHAATECAWLIQEGYSSEMKIALRTIVSALERLKGSWGFAGGTAWQRGLLRLIRRQNPISHCFLRMRMSRKC